MLHSCSEVLVEYIEEPIKQISMKDKTRNLSSNANRKICFGVKAEWNEDWAGERTFNWKEVLNKLL